MIPEDLTEWMDGILTIAEALANECIVSYLNSITGGEVVGDPMEWKSLE